MTIEEHKRLLKLLEKLQKDTGATDKIFKAFMDKVIEIFVSEEEK